MRGTPCRHQARSVEKEKQEVLRVPDLQPMAQTMVRQLWPGSPGSSMMEERSTCSPRKTPCQRTLRYLKEAAACGEKPTQEQLFWQELWLVVHPHWSSPLVKDCTPERRLTPEQFLKNSSPCEVPRRKKLMKDCILWN